MKKFLFVLLLLPGLVFGQNVLTKAYPSEITSFQDVSTLLGGSATNVLGVMTLSNTIAIGSSTLAVVGLIPEGFNSKGVVFQVDPYTSYAETFAVNSISGHVITLSRTNRFAHTNGAFIATCPMGQVWGPSYNIKFDTTTHQATNWQRAILECEDIGAWLVGGLDSGNRISAIEQPLFVAELTARNLRLRVPIDYNTNVNMANMTNVWAMIKTARNPLPFRVSDHATNGILFEPFETAPVGSTIAFNDPYGWGLPAGIASGRLYLVKSISSATNSMTISEILSPGTELDITGNGSGWMHFNHESNTRIKWYDVRLSLEGTNINGFYGNLQQQAFTKHLRIDMSYPGTNNIGAQFVGQGSQHDYLEIDPYSPTNSTVNNTNQTGLILGGGGGGVYHHLAGFTTINGKGGVGVKIYGSGHTIDHLLVESLQHAGVQMMPDASTVRIGQIDFRSVTATNIPCISDLSIGTATYDIGPVRCPTTDAMIARDTTRDYTIHAWDGSTTSGNGDTGQDLMFAGYVQQYGFFAPSLKARRTIINNDARAMRHIDETGLYDTSGGNLVVPLAPLTAGWGGLPQRIVKTDAANTLYVTNRVGDTINGVASYYVLTNKGQSVLMIPTRGREWIPVSQ